VMRILPVILLFVLRSAYPLAAVLHAAAWIAQECLRTGVKADDVYISSIRKVQAQAKTERLHRRTNPRERKRPATIDQSNHSKIATDIFKEWFYAHMRHPFPSDEVKAEFADRTGNPIATARYCRIASLCNFCCSELLHSFSIQIYRAASGRASGFRLTKALLLSA